MTLFDPPDAPEGPTGPVERIRLVVAYDGSRYHGFAPNPGVTTVGGTLTDALGAVLRTGVELTCAGRTDKGVHAAAQVVTFDAPAGLVEPAKLQRAVNKMCGPAIAVRSVDVVDERFDARFSAVSRRYRYRVVDRSVPDPFLAHLAWQVPEPLDLEAMRLGCDAFVGEHDFSAFCRRPRRRGGELASLVRRVREADWNRDEEGDLRFEIEADAFCHQMVRSIVGTLVDVGRGRIRAGEVLGIMRSGDRDRAGQVAPPQGLVLLRVRYEDGWTAG